MEEFNEIQITVNLAKNNTIDQKFYMDIINGLNDRFIPVSEIKVNDEVVFNDKTGFTKKEGN